MASQMQREKQISNINDVTPKKLNWKVLVHVLQKKKGGISKTGPNATQYRGYLFIDTVGTMVSSVIYGTNVEYFDTSFLPYKRYYISNVYVKPVKPGYEVGDYKYSWTLYSTEMVEPLEESVPPPIPYDFQFKKFTEMFRYADRETPINVRGFVVEAFAEKKIGEDMYGRDLIAHDFIVVDSENTPMIMRQWKEKLQEYADILSNGLPERIFFLGLSLSSRLNSVFLKDPVIHDASPLNEWYALNKKEVDHLLANMAYKDTNKLLPNPSASDITNTD